MERRSLKEISMANITWQEAWNKVAEELDTDIKELFEKRDGKGYKVWELVDSPHLTVLMLQLVRELKKKNNV